MTAALAQAAPVVPAQATPALATAAARTRARHLPDLALLVPAAATLAMMLWGISARPYWGDEADTISAVSRSLPQLFRLLGHIDAVHGLYYLLMWPVVRLLGVSEFVTRLPSALAMAAAAYGVAAIGRRLRSRPAGLWAGLVFAALPMVAIQGHDARPYGMVVAAAVLASHQAIGLAADPRPRRFVTYGLAVVLLGYLDLLALVLVAAHTVTMAALAGPASGRPRPPLRGRLGQLTRAPLARWWLAIIVGVAVAAAPMLTWSWWQRSQVSWIQGPSWGDLNYLVTWLALGSVASVLLLGLLGYAGAARQPAGSRALAWLALPWLVVPPLVLMPVSFIDPVYSFRYVVFCLPAVALLAGAGLAAVRPVIRAGAAALIIVLALPVQQGLRTGGGGVRAASQALAAVQRPGDAVIFPGGGIPPWYLVYPQTLGRLRNIGVRQSGAASGRLYATAVPLPVLLQREQSVSRIWVFEMQPSWQDPARYLAPGFRFVTMLRPLHGSVFLALYQRSSGPSR